MKGNVPEGASDAINVLIGVALPACVFAVLREEPVPFSDTVFIVSLCVLVLFLHRDRQARALVSLSGALASTLASGHHTRPSHALAHVIGSVAGDLVLSRVALFRGSFVRGESLLIAQLLGFLSGGCMKMALDGWPSFLLLAAVAVLAVSLRGSHSFMRMGTHCGLAVGLAGSVTLSPSMIMQLWGQIVHSRALLLLWPSLLVCILLLPSLCPRLFATQNALRKFYHFAAVALFLPAHLLAMELLPVALGCAALLFWTLEVCRVQASHGVPPALNRFMARCRNGLDGGRLVLSHGYLLVGCALPVWLCRDPHDLAALSGVIALGMGDSFASIGGRTVGIVSWPQSQKTVGGSLCGWLAMWLSWMALDATQDNRHGPAMLAGLSAISALWEGLTSLNDNLTLPLATLVAFKVLSR